MPPPITEDVSDEESGDIPFRDAPETNGTDEQDAAKDDEEEDEDESGDEAEGVYVVEKIVDHDWLDDGTLKLLVKWKGYESVSDRTWEEEEGLMEGAGDIVNAYYKKVGGRPKKPEEKPTPAKPGRKRKSMGESKTATPTPAPVATEAKRQRRKSAPKETKVAQDSPSSEENGVEWLPKGKNWDKDVKAVDTIVREDDEGLMAWLEFNNGHRAKVALQACYEKCPLKMLKFYESHLVFKDN
ncbi:hypothetical protein N7475_004961 [Penicillium sp. IBT 31633x]|nr:hypothetical protein N7475_004961 [Penicillium sp. IBT 31633x]